MFYLINKPTGITSFQAIKKFANDNHITKIGHSGTLDPLASGALLVATNDDTKLLEYITDQTKTYVATLQFGYVSDTFDRTGKLKKISDQIIQLATIKIALNAFLGKSMQVPPSFSAKKIAGKRSYLLARQGIPVVLKPTPIEVFKICDLKQIESNVFSFEIMVSSGTYIRSLINDIGTKLGVGAIMTELHRTQVGNQKLLATNETIDPLAIINLPTLEVRDLLSLRNGLLINVKQDDGLYLLIFNNQIIGTGKVNNGILKSNKLFGKRITKLIDASLKSS